jgi:hypothetical protein
MPRDRGPVWTSTKNARRGRPLLSLTISRPGQEALDTLATLLGYSRGVVAEAFIIWHTEAVRGNAQHLAVLQSMCAEVANGSEKPSKEDK